ncbi:MAG: 50S ribosomal protein L31 [Fimbriimonadales bacterium]
MKPGIHPNYMECKVYCGCGNNGTGLPVTTIISNVAEMRVDICSKCHPLYTGQQKIVDAAGRVEKFMRRYGKKEAKS